MKNSKLNELLSNSDVNVWMLASKAELKDIVAKASFEELKGLIEKYDDHQMFDFMEDFITDGKADGMNEEQYWEVIEELGLY